jgi:polysaccharide pyruvyl transferase
MEKKYDIGIVGFWYGLNYGSMLTSFALYRTVQNLGYTAVLINRPFDLWERDSRYSDKNLMPNRFFRSNCIVSERDSDFDKLNKECQMFIVGSDTVWNPVLVGKHLPFFFLNFASNEKNKISYASSFGRNQYKVEDPLLRQYARYACSKLNHISVREDLGVEIIKDEFGRNATRVLDPVFLLEPEEYRHLADAGPEMKQREKFIFSYMLGADEPKIKMYQKLVDFVKLSTVNFPKGYAQNNLNNFTRFCLLAQQCNSTEAVCYQK